MKGFGEESKSTKKIRNNSTKPSKEKILQQAIKFQLQGNTSEALKHYQSRINQGFNDYILFAYN